MVVTGSANTLFTKYTQNKPYQFYHGFFSSWLMFIGEIIPILVLNIPFLFNK